MLEYRYVLPILIAMLACPTSLLQDAGILFINLLGGFASYRSHQMSDVPQTFGILEELLPPLARTFASFVEFYDDRCIANLLFHGVMLGIQLHFGWAGVLARMLLHYGWNYMKTELYLSAREINIDPSIHPDHYADLNGVFRIGNYMMPGKPLHNSVEFDQGRLSWDLIEKASKGQPITKNSGKIEVRTKAPLEMMVLPPTPEESARPPKLVLITSLFGVFCAQHVGSSNGYAKIAGVGARLLPPMPVRSSPEMRIYENFLNGTLDSQHELYEICAGIEISTARDYKEVFEDWSRNDIINPETEDLIGCLSTHVTNDFEEIALEFCDSPELKQVVKPRTWRQMLENLKPARRKVYEDMRETMGISDLDTLFQLDPREAGELFEYSNINTTPIFVKNEKYTGKNDPEFKISEEFKEHMKELGLIPQMVIKPRIIAAESLGSYIEGSHGGQLGLLFYTDSVKKVMKTVLSKIRTQKHEITGQEMKIRFVFTTDTSIRNVTMEVREAIEYAGRGVITFLLHGDDSLGFIPTKKGTLIIECDYSTYDRTQDGQPLRGEHILYKFYCRNFPEFLQWKSLQQHGNSFEFKYGSEFVDGNSLSRLRQNFITMIVTLKHSMRHSGGWNTTTGNSVVSAMAIKYVLRTCKWIDGVPQMDTFLELGLVVKPSAFFQSYNMHMMTYLKLGFALGPTGWNAVILPSRLCRLGLILSRLATSSHEKNLEIIKMIETATMIGYCLPPDFPIMGGLASILEARAFVRFGRQGYDMIMSSVEKYKGVTSMGGFMNNIMEDNAIRSYKPMEMVLTAGQRSVNYEPVPRESVIAMMCERYDTNINEILETEENLSFHSSIHGNVLVASTLATKMFCKDYGAEEISTNFGEASDNV
jgi:hypothetical protein